MTLRSLSRRLFLPDGTAISLADWVDDKTYSTVVLSSAVQGQFVYANHASKLPKWRTLRRQVQLAADLVIAIHAKPQTFPRTDREHTSIVLRYLERFVDLGVPAMLRDEREALSFLQGSQWGLTGLVTDAAAAITSYGLRHFVGARKNAENIIEWAFTLEHFEVDDCRAIEAKWRLLDTIGEYGPIPEGLMVAFQTAWMIEEYDFAFEMAKGYWKDQPR